MIASIVSRASRLRGRSWRKPLLLAGIVLLALVAVSLSRGSAPTSSSSDRAATPPMQPGGTKARATNPSPGLPSPRFADESGNAASLAQREPADEALSAQSGSRPGPLPLPPLGVNIIKTATLALEVKKDRVEEAYQRALVAVQAVGGYTLSSTTSPSKAGDTLLLAVRVPSRAFESTLAEFRKLGKVDESAITTQDVTDEFVDLNSRLKHWRAQEAVLLNLMAKAKSVEQSLAVQQHLSQVQMEIETITGRLRYLENQTSFSTIALTLRPVAPAAKKVVDPWGFKAATAAAKSGFMGTVRVGLISFAYLSPILVLGAIAWLTASAYAAARRRVGRPAAP